MKVDGRALLEAVTAGGVLFESPDGAYAGEGELNRIELPFSFGTVATSLNEIGASLRKDDVAFVSVPFSSSKSVLAIVPEQLLEAAGPLTSSGSQERPTDFTIEPARAPKAWCDSVVEAVTRIKRGDLDKVVLARRVDIEADRAFDLATVIANLRTGYPSAYRFVIDGLVGASPELLISRTGNEIFSYPLAGTRANSGDATSANELLSSEKEQTEHGYLSHSVASVLAPFCEELEVDKAPGVLASGNIQHLATHVRGRLRNTSTTVLDLVSALHPTPAVGGTPTEKAIALIAELEEMDRGRYAGAVGWMNGRGDGCFAVAIRCAQIEGNKAHLFAGNGIVEASEPARELEETQLKLQPMLNALVRP